VEVSRKAWTGPAGRPAKFGDQDKEDNATLRKCVAELQESPELVTKDVPALAAGGGHAAPQNAAATARTRGPGRGKPGCGVQLAVANTPKLAPAASVSS